MEKERRNVRVKKEHVERIKGYDNIPKKEETSEERDNFTDLAENREGFEVTNNRTRIGSGEKVWTPDPDKVEKRELYDNEIENVGKQPEAIPEREKPEFRTINRYY